MILAPHNIETSSRLRLNLAENAQQNSKPDRLSSEFSKFKILLIFVVCVVVLEKLCEGLLRFIEYL